MIEPDALHLLLLALAGAVAAAVNAVAGGGGLLVFPALLATGIPALHANVTGSLAALPGLYAAAWAARGDLQGQSTRLRWALLAAPFAGAAGAWMLLRTGAQAFEALVPWLILAATTLFYFGPRLKAAARARLGAGERRPDALAALAATSVAASLYSGYFGGGLSVMLLAALSLLLDEDRLPRINALRMAMVAVAKTGAVAYFVWDGSHVVWPAAVAVAVGGAAGGALGGRLAGRIAPRWLRAMVLLVGFTAAAVFFVSFGHRPTA